MQSEPSDGIASKFEPGTLTFVLAIVALSLGSFTIENVALSPTLIYHAVACVLWASHGSGYIKGYPQNVTTWLHNLDA